METRLANLLKTVVEVYTRTAQPVGSQYLVEYEALDVSPATVRNWFSELEEAGCITQPHTSGGRIPTEKGFRLYVELFVRSRTLSKRDQDALNKCTKNISGSTDNSAIVKQLVKVLAEISGLAGIAGLCSADTYYTGLAQLFSQPEFRDVQRVVSLSDVLDHLDEALSVVRKERFDGPKILIGHDCPFGLACGCVIVSYEDSLFGILGPIRMDYVRVLSLMNGVIRLIK